MSFIQNLTGGRKQRRKGTRRQNGGETCAQGVEPCTPAAPAASAEGGRRRKNKKSVKGGKKRKTSSSRSRSRSRTSRRQH